MNYRIVTKPAFKVIGFDIHTTTQDGKNHQDIPAFWQDYLRNDRSSRIPNRVHKDTPVELGICHSFDMTTGSFIYTIGMEAEHFESIEDNELTCHEFDTAEYAVFTTPKSPLDQFSQSIQNTWSAIFSEWFPHNDYEHAGTPELEIYDERSNPEHGEVQMDIYIPIKRKEA
ncbi:GyrI-like domain-containing protein [Paenibacillus xylaniclasticus]|uniref:GyrI-like domain-containing protein n=1 Tax=Paenibacillus xylaniclasticus TaxID=588083 RepID=UPI00175EEBAE|nr:MULTISPECIES: GyrI-like domain-containing protein [Paenibacillus]GFN31474.1 hypothetical protein PCURB6_17340 [Paenibacillus curdlanolyticus]